MDITPVIRKDQNYIDRYGNSGFQITGRHYTGSIVVSSSEVLEWHTTDRILEDIESLLELFAETPKIQVLLVGCGDSPPFIPERIRKGFRKKCMTIDVMSTGAACRTYNVLLAEDRLVAAALVAI